MGGEGWLVVLTIRAFILYMPIKDEEKEKQTKNIYLRNPLELYVRDYRLNSEGKHGEKST